MINNQRNSSSTIYWDAHACPPLKVGADLSFLNRYKKAGVDCLFLNVGFDLITQNQSLSVIDYFSKWIEKNDDQFALVKNVAKLLEDKQQGKLSIGFDIEGCNLLNSRLDMVSKFYSLGVKQLIFAYNNNNMSGGGCFDQDIGLTSFGRDLVKECNDVGMVIDCSHVSYKTSMEIIERSQYPVIFSHSNPFRLVDHPRNIRDEQIIACVSRGGVIGINGISIFLGDNDASTEKIVEHIDYIVQIAGVKHVGLGLDCVFDENETKEFVNNNPKTFPAILGLDEVKVAKPEQFAELNNLLAARGYTSGDINLIMGENFLRIAQSVWK